MPFSSYFPFVPSLCLLPLSFCIPLAARYYQCSYCQGWKSEGGLMRPSDNGHMLAPSVGFLCSVCVHWLKVCDKAFVCLGSTSLSLMCSPDLAAGVWSKTDQPAPHPWPCPTATPSRKNDNSCSGVQQHWSILWFCLKCIKFNLETTLNSIYYWYWGVYPECIMGTSDLA